MAVVKKSRFCGPGCECRDCVNLPVQQPVESESEGEGNEESDTHSDDSFLSNNQLHVEVEVITNTDDFLFDFPDIV